MSVKRMLSALVLFALFLAPTSAFAQANNNQGQGEQMSEREAQRLAQQAQQRAKAQEAAVQARMRQIEARMDQEAKLLERRMNEANQIRQAALQKNDQRGLDKAEQYEKQAIAAYEASLDKLIKAMNAPIDQPLTQQARGQQQQRGPQQQQQRRQPPKRRGWSWWPF